MNCPACAFDNPAEMKFCGQCAAPLRAACPRCGFENPPGFKFCGECAGPLGGESAEGGSAGASPSLTVSHAPTRVAPEPRSYTPKHLAEKILASKSALEGERKQVTVLFADVKGSMELAEQVDPEDWHRILNRFFEILTDGVHRFEGTVNQYTGDGIMALFGAPITHEDHAHRACFAALHLQDELRRYAEEIKRTRGLNFSVRMGINSGEVVVGKIGDDLRMDYTAQGHTVGLASRLEQLAESGKAYVSEDTARIVSGYFALRDLGSFELKGVGRPLRVHELDGVGEMRTRLDVSRARGLSRFVGRADEMEMLDRALARVHEGHAQVVGVVAAAGTGKSRLCYEFIEKCKAQGLRVREAHGVPHGKSVPFLPVFEFLRGFFGVTDRDTDEDARKRIAGTLLLLDKDLIEALPVLFEFLGIADPNDPSPRMDPDARQRQLFALTRRILHARNRVETGLILVEDMHWMDGGSEVFLEQLVEALPGTRTLLLVNFRPEYQQAWLQKSFYQQIALHPLGPAEISELLQHLLGRHPSLGDLPDRIRERAAGNPYFIEEIVRSLEETGSLQGTRGAYRLAGAVGSISIPASVQAVLGARIDRLAEREKRLLQTASVIGKEFSEPVLRKVADLPDPDLAEALRVLTGAEYIYEESIYPALEYAFTHPLTQDVAYRSQLADRRSRVHGDVARALLEFHRDKLDERAALIAHHFENAGESLEAARWHQRAAEWAGVRDPAEALRHWRSVRSLLVGLSDSSESTGLGLMACIQILGFGFRMGLNEEEFTKVFDEGVTIAKRANNPHAVTLMLNLRNAVNATSGRIDQLLKDMPETLRAMKETGDPGLELSVQSAVIYGLIGAGRLREGLGLVETVLANPPDDPLIGLDLIGVSPFIQIHWLGSFALAYLGRTAEALEMFHRCLALSEEHGQTELAGWSRGILSLVAYLTGDARGALEAARISLSFAEKIGSTLSLVTACWSLGTAHLVRGEWNEARDALERALELARRGQAGRFMESRVLSYLSEVHVHAGENEKALETARAALTISREGGMKSFECAAQVALARALMADEGAGARQEIEVSLAEALRLAEETGARYWQPFIEERRAQLARLLGDEPGRRRALEEARRLFTEMDASVNAQRIAEELEG